jgi:hypothetical protein
MLNLEDFMGLSKDKFRSFFLNQTPRKSEARPVANISPPEVGLRD